MDATLKKVLKLMAPAEPPDVRRAAARIVTELAPPDDESRETIRRTLKKTA